MKFRNIQIRFDDDHQQYYKPGECIRGRASFSVPHMIKVRVLRINFSGMCKVKWTVSSNDDEKTYKSKEVYFDLNQFLIGSEGSRAEESITGQQVHRFQFTLPQNIPSTFKGKYGEIVYSVTLTAEFPGTFTSDESFTRVFAVINPINMFIERPWSEVVYNQLHLMAEHADDACCASSTDRIKFDVTTNKGAYDPGESVVLNGYVMNESSRATENVFMELVQHVTFYGRRSDFSFTSSGNLKCKEKKHVVSVWKGENAASRKTIAYSNRNSLHIPDSIVESGLRNCSFVDVRYAIKYVVEMPGMCSMTLSYTLPLNIGNGNTGSTQNDSNIFPSAPEQPAISQFESATAPLPSYDEIKLTDKDVQPPPPPSYASATNYYSAPDQSISAANPTLPNDTTPQSNYYDWSQSAFTYN